MSDERELPPSPGPATGPELLARLEKILAETRPGYLDERAPGLTPEELAACERKLGLRLPEAFRRFLQWRDGQARDVNEGLWFGRELLDAARIIEERSQLNELLTIYWPSFEKCLETLVVAHERGYRGWDDDHAEASAVTADEELIRRVHAELNPGYPRPADARGSLPTP